MSRHLNCRLAEGQVNNSSHDHRRATFLRFLGVVLLGQCVHAPVVLAADPAPTLQLQVTVPAISALGLAGQPVGRRLTGNCAQDSAPVNSPVEIQLPAPTRQAVQFSGAVGRVSIGTTADGAEWVNIAANGNGKFLSSGGAAGLSAVRAGGGALVGLFLRDDAPNTSFRPPDLDFTGGLRDLPTLQPLLQQLFYIGDGRTSDGLLKYFIVPEGATRLFLGVQDYNGCYSPNTGAFTLTVTVQSREDLGLLKPLSTGDAVLIPAVASLSLAGQIHGTPLAGSCSLDSAPSNSPIEVRLPSEPDQVIQVGPVLGRVAVGTAADGPSWISISPDGISKSITSSGGFGLSGLTAPAGAAAGVFLTDGVPIPTLQPPDLDFSGGLLEAPVLQPGLQQVFYIGNGRTLDDIPRSFVVPEGATRLLLGVHDFRGCSSPNTGSFTLSLKALSRSTINLLLPIQPGDTFNVPATASPGLAGQGAGVRLKGACVLDSAPFNSPVEVQLPAAPNQAVQIAEVLGRVATGSSADGPGWISISPAGNNSIVTLSPSFGLSGLKAPGGALVGVFLGKDPPKPGLQPLDLDFSGGLRELSRFKPLLQQAFYIGSGRTSGNALKTFPVPEGATRLCLGVQDYNGCYSPNTGWFTVKVTVITQAESEPPDPVKTGVPFEVPALWALGLAGQPDGTLLKGQCALDSAPLNSPLPIPLTKLAGQVIQVPSVNGAVSIGTVTDGPAWVNIPPAGNGLSIPAAGGFGLSALVAPGGSLVGVFLGNTAPSIGLWPPDLDFSGGLRDLAVLSPLLQQSFYIGNGRTSNGQIKSFVVPAGATRLFLAVQDYNGCFFPNSGAFSVTLAAVDPSVLQAFNAIRIGNSFSLSVVGTAGKSYALEYKKALTDPTWITLPSKPGVTGVNTLTDFPVADRQRFYRVIVQ